MSITDMEMRIGALNDNMEDSIFLIKENIQFACDRHKKLYRDIKASKCRWKIYGSLEDVTLYIEEAFMAVLDKYYPQAELSDNHVQHHLNLLPDISDYIPNKADIDSVKSFIESSDYYLASIKGGGKSSLFAYMIANEQNKMIACLYYSFKRYEEDDIIEYFRKNIHNGILATSDKKKVILILVDDADNFINVKGITEFAKIIKQLHKLFPGDKIIIASYLLNEYSWLFSPDTLKKIASEDIATKTTKKSISRFLRVKGKHSENK